jgi:hypothetical protein
MGGAEVNWDDLLPRLQRLADRLDYIEKYLVDLGEATGYRYGPFSSGLPAEVAELARAGKTLEAVKLYRQLTNASFDQAKVAVQQATVGGG